MARDFIIVRSGDEPPRAIIERKVFRFDGQKIDRRLNQAAPQKSRDGQISAGHVMPEVHRIAGKDFVTTIAAQGHGHMLARETRQQIGRND